MERKRRPRQAEVDSKRKPPTVHYKDKQRQQVVCNIYEGVAREDEQERTAPRCIQEF